MRISVRGEAYGRGRRWVVAVCAFAIIMSLSACSPSVRLNTVSADLIPEEFKHAIETLKSLGHSPTKIVWRVYKEFEDYTLVACTYEITIEEGHPLESFYICASGERADWSVDSMGGGLKPGTKFTASEVYRRGESGIEHLDLLGIALDPRIIKIRAVTTGGTVVETEPFDGFWVIPFGVKVNNEKWKEITALDSHGHLIYSRRVDQNRR